MHAHEPLSGCFTEIINARKLTTVALKSINERVTITNKSALFHQIIFSCVLLHFLLTVTSLFTDSINAKKLSQITFKPINKIVQLTNNQPFSQNLVPPLYFRNLC